MKGIFRVSKKMKGLREYEIECEYNEWNEK
jgi:hypothetical protein